MSNIAIYIDYNFSFGTRGTADGQFDYPTGLCILNDEIYVCDRQNNRIQVFDLTGVYVREFGSAGSDDGEMLLPTGIATDGNYLYVVDSANHRIQVFSDTGVFIGKFGSNGSGNDNFNYPTDISINTSLGMIVISDTQNHRVKIHSLSGYANYANFGHFGTNDNQLKFPEGVCFDGNYIQVSDAGNHFVKKFNLSGIFQSKINKYFEYPVGVEVIADGRIVVMDKIGNILYIYDAFGRLISTFGITGTGDGEFFFPLMAKATDDEIFITDSANQRVQSLSYYITEESNTYVARILALSKQLYPTGRAWWLNINSKFNLFTEALAMSESRALESSIGILNSIIPDNEYFDLEDCRNWERALGLITNEAVSLENRKLAIYRKMQYPGRAKARQHYLYLQEQLQLAGFDVYVNENRVDTGGGVYEVTSPLSSLYGLFLYGEKNYAESSIGTFSKIANFIDESKDEGFTFGGDISLRSTFFIGGENIGDRANVLATRKDEFRELILRIKPAQTAGFLLIDYI